MRFNDFARTVYTHSRNIVFLFIAVIPLFVCVSCSNATVDVDLSGKWELICSDKDHFNNGKYAFKRAECTIPGDWKWLLNESPEFVSYVWLVKEFSVPESLKNKPLVLSLGRIALSDRTFFNGVEIGCTGYMPQKENPLDYGFAFKYSRNYYIPTNIVRYDRKNIVTVQVFSHICSGFFDSPFITSHFNWEKQCRIIEYLPIIQNLGVIAINILLFLILVHITEKVKWLPFLLYPLMLVIVSTIIHVQILGIPFWRNGLTRFQIILFCFVVGAISVYLTMIHFIKERRRWLFYCFCGMSIFSILVIVYTPDTMFFIEKTVPVFLTYFGLCSIYVCVPFFMRLINERLKYLYLCLMVLPLGLIIVNAYMHIITLKSYQIPYLGYLLVPVILSNVIIYSIYEMKSACRNNGICTDENAGAVQKSTKSTQKEIIYQIQQYLDCNFRSGYDRADLARQFNIHDNYMVQLFKKVTGTTISNYINIQRIKAAKDLIKNSESRIIDIAYHVGFDNLTHFYRLFKKTTGMTPNEYRSRDKGCEGK